ncbi:MAG: hypothetical protein HUU21_29250 [Polyangiaceae bacterium]|nr:hypothetical protein [Polyangiaceae bacterium]
MDTRPHRIAAPLAFALATFASSQALAVRTPEHARVAGLEVAEGIRPVRPEIEVSYSQAQIPKTRKAAWDAFLAASGSKEWQVLWDTSTAVPSRIFGKGIEAPGSIESPEAAERHARAFLAKHIDLIAPGASPEHFKLAANEIHKGLRTVAFTQLAPAIATEGKDGAKIPVVNGQLSFRFKNNRLFVIASEAIPFAAASSPQITAAAAESAARAWMIHQSGSAEVSAPAELVVLPLIRARGVETRTVYRVLVKAGSIKLPHAVYIDARSGMPVARESLASFLSATALYDVPTRYPQEPGPRLSYPGKLTEIVLDGAASFTDTQGVFTWPGPGDAAVEFSVHSEHTHVSNYSGNDVTGPFSAAGGSQITWSLAADEHGDAQLSGFVHAAIAKERARLIAPAMPFLFQKLYVNVNRDDPMYKCNAYWDGSSINFFIQYNPCNNTARVADVVYHEFGHGFHQHARINGAALPDPALGEGQSDYFACTVTNDPNMGPGFFVDGTVLRHCKNNREWPEDIDPDPHETGLIFTGAMWDIREALILQYGEQEGVALADALYFGAIQRAANLPSTYAEVLAEDDDDGDLANGTPNICVINQAFGDHGLSPYLNKSGLTIEHKAISSLPVGPNPYELRVTQKILFPQCGAGKLESVKAQWGITGTTSTIDFTPDGDEFVGAIPPLPDGTGFRYRVVASADGKQLTLPDNPADDAYKAFVGEVVPLYCNDFEAQIDGWTLSDSNGGKGDFKLGIPEGLAEDPAAAFSGSMVLGNDITVNGLYPSDKEIYADSPLVELQGNTRVRLQFRRWLAVEDGYYDQASIYANGKRVWENQGTDESFGSLHHVDKEWRFEDIDLSSIPSTGGTNVKIRFELTSDQGFEMGGWTIDDFCIVAWTPAPVEMPTSGAGGAGGSGGSGGDMNGDPTEEADAGCGCGVAGKSPFGFAPLAFLALGLAARRLRGFNR